jgi:hypothetical protein
MVFLRNGQQKEGTARMFSFIKLMVNIIFPVPFWSILNQGYVIECDPTFSLFISFQVINNILASSYANLYNPENILYRKMVEVEETIGHRDTLQENGYTMKVMEMIDREAEGSDSLEVRQHNICGQYSNIAPAPCSFAGGTGSGLGSFLLERLNDKFHSDL